MFVTLDRPSFPELLEELLLVQWVLLHVHSLPLLTSVLVCLLLSVLVQAWNSLSVLVQDILHLPLTAPLPLIVQLPVGYKDMGVRIIVVLVVVYGVSTGVPLFRQILPDIVLDYLLLFGKVNFPWKGNFNLLCCPCVFCLLVVLYTVEQDGRITVFFRRIFRNECADFKHSFHSAVRVRLSGSLLVYFIGGDIRKRGTGRRAFGSADVGYRAMVNCHVFHLAFLNGIANGNALAPRRAHCNATFRLRVSALLLLQENL